MAIKAINLEFGYNEIFLLVNAVLPLSRVRSMQYLGMVREKRLF